MIICIFTNSNKISTTPAQPPPPFPHVVNILTVTLKIQKEEQGGNCLKFPKKTEKKLNPRPLLETLTEIISFCGAPCIFTNFLQIFKLN